MKPWDPPSGLNRGLPFTVQATWTPEQALAVMGPDAIAQIIQ
jgi:hypothetical protein